MADRSYSESYGNLTDVTMPERLRMVVDSGYYWSIFDFDHKVDIADPTVLEPLLNELRTAQGVTSASFHDPYKLQTGRAPAVPSAELERNVIAILAKHFGISLENVVVAD